MGIDDMKQNISQKHPAWIHSRISAGEEYQYVRKLLTDRNLNTVCVEAACPNKGECWNARHVTFMILGKVCTRKCRFCNVSEGRPEPVDQEETKRIAEAVKELQAKNVVITSVTRDDLPDKGANQFVSVVKEIKNLSPETKIELLIPDLDADASLLKTIASSGTQIIGHNIEMPEKLYSVIRPGSVYQTSIKTLKLLAQMKTEGAPILVKSSIMIGLGETKEDLLHTFKDLKTAGVDIVYIGQYLSPSQNHYPVKKYYTPEEFKYFEQKACETGFSEVCCAPLIRSSSPTNN